jgi:hypothetical protein
MSELKLVVESGFAVIRRDGQKVADDDATCTAFIAALEAECERLRGTVEDMCHAYDDNVGNERRDFSDEEEWNRVEEIARAALAKE